MKIYLLLLFFYFGLNQLSIASNNHSPNIETEYSQAMCEDVKKYTEGITKCRVTQLALPYVKPEPIITVNFLPLFSPPVLCPMKQEKFGCIGPFWCSSLRVTIDYNKCFSDNEWKKQQMLGLDGYQYSHYYD